MVPSSPNFGVPSWGPDYKGTLLFGGSILGGPLDGSGSQWEPLTGDHHVERWPHDFLRRSTVSVQGHIGRIHRRAPFEP